MTIYVLCDGHCNVSNTALLLAIVAIPCRSAINILAYAARIMEWKNAVDICFARLRPHRVRPVVFSLQVIGGGADAGGANVGVYC